MYCYIRGQLFKSRLAQLWVSLKFEGHFKAAWKHFVRSLVWISSSFGSRDRLYKRRLA